MKDAHVAEIKNFWNSWKSARFLFHIYIHLRNALTFENVYLSEPHFGGLLRTFKNKGELHFGGYGVATISRLLKIISLLQKSPTKETYFLQICVFQLL